MKIDSAIPEQENTSDRGDEQRFKVSQIIETVIIPRELKERRVALENEIANIDATLAKLEAMKNEKV